MHLHLPKRCVGASSTPAATTEPRGASCGRCVIDFTRQAQSLEEAIATALADVRTAGHDVEHIEIKAGAVTRSA